MLPDLAKALAEIVEPLAKRLRILEAAEHPTFAASVEPVTFAALPAAGQAGRVLFVSDGRKNGEGAGLGTGILVFDDGTNWKTSDTSTTVAV